VQCKKYRPSLNLWVITPGVHPNNVSLGYYDVGKFSAGCLDYSSVRYMRTDTLVTVKRIVNVRSSLLMSVTSIGPAFLTALGLVDY